LGRGGGDEEEDDGEGYREEEQQMQADARHCGLRPVAGRRSHGGEADETKDTQTEREGERRDLLQRRVYFSFHQFEFFFYNHVF
jgi:hypothetical protein